MTALLQIPEIVPDGIDRVTVPFGEWLPDQPELNNPGAIEALNVMPVEGSYTPFPQLVYNPASLTSFTDPVIGALRILDENDVVQRYTATTVGIYVDLGAGNAAVGGPYNVDAKFGWQIFRVNDQVVFIHPDEQLFRYPVGGGGPLVIIGGNPPKAECGAQVGDFLMVGNLHDDPDDAHGSFPERVRWSGLNNIDLPWISDPITQADFQDMPGAGGPVRAISGREYGTIFQERSISRATYRGLPDVFDITTVEDKRGCIARDSIVDVGPVQFGIAEDGFFMWNGTNTELIGTGRVDRYFFKRLLYSARARIKGVADFVNGCVLWAFPTDNSGLLTELIIYSYKENRWSHAIQTLEYIVEGAKSNTTIDMLTGPLESYSGSFDDDIYRNGGVPQLSGFNELHQAGDFVGDPLAATIDTGESTGPNGRRIFINNVRPVVDLAVPQATVQAIYRDQMIGEPPQYSAQAAQEVDGQCPLTADGRYMRFRVNIPVGASWRHAIGVEVARKPAGAF